MVVQGVKLVCGSGSNVTVGDGEQDVFSSVAGDLEVRKLDMGMTGDSVNLWQLQHGMCRVDRMFWRRLSS